MLLDPGRLHSFNTGIPPVRPCNGTIIGLYWLVNRPRPTVSSSPFNEAIDI